MTPPVFVGRVGPQAEAFPTAMKLALQTQKDGRSLSVTLAVPALTHLTGVIDAYLGERLVRSLESEGEVRFPSFMLYVATKRRSPAREPGPVVAAFATLPQLTQLLNDPRTTHLYVAPWGEEDIDHVLRLVPGAERF